ncbi:MAG: S1-like domain-containing RNA-binding protein [Eubacteriales bacterium]|nr:S1-like domain-containing RNA-binding protein [Eubacteriales bacterium]
MLEIGKKQTLIVSKIVDFGVYLSEGPQALDQVLLPGKEVPEGTELWQPLEVFLYRDSEDRMIATTRTPYVELGKIALLKVKDTGRIGAFLDWGLEKDLLLPFREQTKHVRRGEECLIGLYVDRTRRLCATMNVYRFLRTDSAYQREDRVKGRVYEISENFGIFVAVDDCYSAMVPKTEASDKFHVGDIMEFRVTGVKPDGKLDLSTRERVPEQIETDMKEVMQVIDDFDGVLPFDDHADPEIIRREFGMSKNSFKRAVGRLLKQQKVEIKEGKIYKIEKSVDFSC